MVSQNLVFNFSENDSSGANFAVMFMRNHEIEMVGGVNPFMSPVPHAQLHIPCEYAALQFSFPFELCFVCLHMLVYVGLTGKPGVKTSKTWAAAENPGEEMQYGGLFNFQSPELSHPYHSKWNIWYILSTRDTLSWSNSSHRKVQQVF